MNLKLFLKSPMLFSFGTNLAHFLTKPGTAGCIKLPSVNSIHSSSLSSLMFSLDVYEPIRHLGLDNCLINHLEESAINKYRRRLLPKT